MRKLLTCLLGLGVCSAYAANNNLFQEFDNQVSIGYGMNQTTSTVGTNPLAPAVSGLGATGVSTVNVLNLEAERLLNNGIWVDINANMAFGAGPSTSYASTMNNGSYSNPSDYGINGKVGYAFTSAHQHFQVTPYGMVGLVNTAGANAASFVSTANAQFANQFAYLAGVGARLEYRINRAIMLFADQSAGYSWDQSGPIYNVQPQNNVIFTSTLGAKFNVAKNLQLGVKGFYTNYQPQVGNNSNVLDGFGNTYPIPQAQSSLGGLVSVGLTY